MTGIKELSMAELIDPLEKLANSDLTMMGFSEDPVPELEVRVSSGIYIISPSKGQLILSWPSDSGYTNPRFAIRNFISPPKALYLHLTLRDGTSYDIHQCRSKFLEPYLDMSPEKVGMDDYQSRVKELRGSIIK